MKKLIAILLVVVMVLSLAACAGKKDEGMSHEEFLAAETDAEVTVVTYVQAGESWWDGAVALYCQGPDGGHYLYGMKCTEEDAAKLVPGTKIKATGTKAVWNGEVEIMDGTIEILSGDPYIAEATDVTALLGTDELASHMNKLVAFKGLTVVASVDPNGNEVPFLYNWDGSGAAGESDVYFTLTDGTNNLTLTVNRYMIGTGTDSAAYTGVEALQIGDKVDVEGFLYWYNDAQPHVTAITPAA